MKQQWNSDAWNSMKTKLKPIRHPSNGKMCSILTEPTQCLSNQHRGQPFVLWYVKRDERRMDLGSARLLDNWLLFFIAFCGTIWRMSFHFRDVFLILILSLPMPLPYMSFSLAQSLSFTEKNSVGNGNWILWG